MRRLLLLFPLCLLLASTELRAQENDTHYYYILLQLLKSSCPENCYREYKNKTDPMHILEICGRASSISSCEKLIRDRAREDYEMCLLKCQY